MRIQWLKKLGLSAFILLSLFGYSNAQQWYNVSTLSNIQKDFIYSQSCTELEDAIVYSGEYGIYLNYFQNPAGNPGPYYLHTFRPFGSGSYFLFNNSINPANGNNDFIIFNRPYLSANNWAVQPGQKVRHLTTAEEIGGSSYFQFGSWFFNTPKVINVAGIIPSQQNTTFANPNYRNAGHPSTPTSAPNYDYQIRSLTLFDTDNNQNSTNDNSVLVACLNLRVQWCGDGILTGAKGEECEPSVPSSIPAGYSCNAQCKLVQLPAPTCSASIVTPSVNPGASFTLTWSSTNTTSVSSITANPTIGGFPLTNVTTNGSQQFTAPTTPGIYNITVNAAGAGGTTQCPAQLTVIAPAPTCSASIVTPSVNPGAPFTLTWSSTNTTSVSSITANPTIGGFPLTNVATNGSQQFTAPTTPGIYNITVNADGAGGTTQCPAQLTVNAFPAPVCNSLNATPASGLPGLVSQLNCTATNATSSTIQITGPNGYSQTINGFNGSTNSLTAPGAYTATCAVSGNGGSNVSSPACSTTINVSSFPAPTCNFTIQGASTVTAGQITTLTWNTTNSTQAAITAQPNFSPFTYAVPGAQLANGQLQFTAPASAGTYNLSLVTTGNGNQRIVCPAILTVTPAGTPDLWIIKDATPTSSISGGIVTFTIRYGNSGTVASTGVKITDILPLATQFTYISSNPAGNTVGNTIEWTIGTLNPGQQGTIILTGRVGPISGPATLTNTGTISGSTPEINLSNNTDTAIVSIPGDSDLWIRKTANKQYAKAGEVVTYQITIGNSGQSIANNVGVLDYMPKNIKFISAVRNPSVGTFSTGFTIIGNTIAEMFTRTGFNLNPGQTATITVTAQVIGAECQYMMNWSYVYANITGDFVGSAEDQSSATVLCSDADVRIKKTVSTGTVSSGSVVTYIIDFGNSGGTIATGVVVTDILPAGLTGITFTGQVYGFIYRIFDLNPVHNAAGTNPAGTPIISLSGGNTPSNSGVFNSGNNPVRNTGNNSNTLSSFSGGNTPISPTIPNLEVVTFTGGNILSFSSITNPVGRTLTGSFSGSQIIIPVGDLYPGQTGRIIITGIIYGNFSQYTNTGIISTPTPEVTTGNNTSVVTSTGGNPDVYVFKATDKTIASSGENVTFTIRYGNSGLVTAYDVVLQDILPTGLQYLSISPSQAYPSIFGSGWNLGTLTPGQQGTIILTGKVLIQSGLLINTAIINASGDTNTGNNISQTGLVLGDADMWITKVANPTTNVSSITNAIVTFTIRYGNSGAIVAQNVRVTDILPAGFDNWSATPSPDGNIITNGWTIGSVNPGQQGVIVLTGRYIGSNSTTQVLTNTGIVSTTTPEVTTGNNVATAQVETVAWVCGNAIIDPNEQCDLGAPNGRGPGNGVIPSGQPYAGQSCNQCLAYVNNIPVCGNNIVEMGEQCDLGSGNNNATPVPGMQGYTCTSQCLLNQNNQPVAYNPPRCGYVDVSSTNTNSLSVQSGEIVPFYRDVEENNFSDSCNSSSKGYIRRGSLTCDFAVFNGLNPEYDYSGNQGSGFRIRNVSCRPREIGLGISSQTVTNFGNIPLFNHMAQRNIPITRDGEYYFALDPQFFGGILGEYKLSLEQINYEVCNGTGFEAKSFDRRVCQANFAVTKPYLMQRGGLSNVTNTDLRDFSTLRGASFVDEFEVRNVTTNSYDGGQNLRNIMSSFVEVQRRIAVSSSLPASLNGAVGDVKKVPSKEIYIIENSNSNSINAITNGYHDKPYTVIVPNGNLVIKGNLRGNGMFIVPNGTIYFDTTDCDTQQVVNGIFIAGNQFDTTPNSILANRSNIVKNTDLKTGRCTDGRLKVNGILAGKGVTNLINNRRSALNQWFLYDGSVSGEEDDNLWLRRRQDVYEGASLLIETNTSLRSNLPPGASEFSSVFEVLKR